MKEEDGEDKGGEGEGGGDDDDEEEDVQAYICIPRS